jgi:acetyl coenzyme A synthetase (ADP forming)-like protein
MNEAHALYIPAPYQDHVDSGRLIFRDGMTATLRVATPTDQGKLKEFFARLSPESREQRFLSVALPPDDLIQRLCDSSNPLELLTLVVVLVRRSGPQTTSPDIVAAGSYISRGNQTAEVAMAVDDQFQGKGIGTQLLERLAIIAIRNGFVRFWAVTRMENRSMIEVFRNSGFPVQERFDRGLVEIDFSVTPTQASVELSELRDRLSTAASIRPFFKPNAVAVVGASRNPSSIGYRILDELVRAGFQRGIYPVNPKADVINGLTVYPSVTAIPQPVDLAIIAVPRDAVLAVVDDCAARGVRALIVITAGFSESDQTGRDLQKQLLDKVRGYGMRMVGPNCMGLLNADPSVRLNASFSPVFPPAGALAMSSQSGALGLAILALAAERQLGLSTFVSVGNKADVSSNDLIQYWEADDQTRVILLYLESFGNPRRFARIVRRVGRSKPIVAVKAGRSISGRRAAGSHTAALAANDVAVDALFQQSGVVRAETLDELFDIAAMLGSQPLISGRRIGIVTNAGGPGILCTDACEAGGLSVPEFSTELRGRLRSFLPAAAGVANPVDMVASAGPDAYRHTIESVLASSEIDALVVIYISLERGDSQTVIGAITEGLQSGRAAGGGSKPVLACMMSSDLRQNPLRIGSETIPVYSFPESAARVLSKCARYGEWRSSPPGMIPAFGDIDPEKARRIVRDSLQANGAGWLSASDVTDVLDAFRIPRPASGMANTAAEAVTLAERIGYPVALKAVSSQIVHKTDVGGVQLNLNDASTVTQAFDRMQKALAAPQIMLQEMISGGVELMIGVTTDPLFGPLIAFGLGGIHVEILADVRFRITPLTDRDARSMVHDIRGYRLLEGYRGHAPADVTAIEKVLLRVSRLVEEIPEITDLDLNPIVALPPGEGCCALDARIRVATAS